MSKGTCAVDGCDRQVRCRGWCKAHYDRWLRTGSLGSPEVTARLSTGQPCAAEGCDAGARRGGYCWMHYRRVRAYGDPLTIRFPMTGAKNPAWRGDDCGYSQAHRRVSLRRGKASDHPCITCGDRAHEWAYDHTCPRERHEMMDGYDVPYSPDPDRYQPMCTSCHRNQDKRIAKDRRLRAGSQPRKGVGA